MKFELTILGCSGGPLDGKTCSFLLKPSKISYDEILKSHDRSSLVCIDAGTGLSGICDIVHGQRESHRRKQVDEENPLLMLYDDSLTVDEYTNCCRSYPFLQKDGLLHQISPYQLAMRLMNLMSCYLITHSHMDHVSGLVVNSAGFSTSKSSGIENFKAKTIYGTQSTIKVLKRDYFNGYVWPDLISDHVGIISAKEVDDTGWTQVSKYFKTKPFVVSHGECPGGKKPFDSTAFLIADVEDTSRILIFGDVEADAKSKFPRNYKLWEAVAPDVVSGKLGAIVIECSNLNLPNDTPLYGHMTPNLLLGEFLKLREYCKDERALEGLTVIIIHVKEDFSGKDPRQRILKQLQVGSEAHNLGIKFTMALPGLSYYI